MVLDGVHVSLTTPFYPDGRVYLRKLEHNVRRLSLTPVSGLIALGPAGEAASLTDAEQHEILRTVAATAAPEKVLLAGIQHAGVLPALALAETAAIAHFDALLLTAPATLDRAWNESEPTADLLTWFRAIADQAPLPILLNTHAAGHDLPIATLAQLADHPNILGVLEASLHISRVAGLHAATAHLQRTATTTVTFTAATQRMLQPTATAPPGAPASPGAPAAFVSAESLAGAGAAGAAALASAPAMPALKTRTKAVGFQILWAHAADSTEALRAGAVGLAPAVAASVPQAVFEIWAAWKDGDVTLMQEKQQRVTAAEPFLLHHGTAALKAAAELSGYFGGRPRLPHLPPTAAQTTEITRLLDGMRS